MRVLVAYGSKREGTAGIASMLADGLRKLDLAVDVFPASAVRDPNGYDAVIVGGALYANRWQRDARRLVERFANDLLLRPVWFFSSGPLDDSASEEEIPPTPQVQKLMKLVGARGHATFGGRLAPDARGFPASAMARTRAGDWRDPQRIATWASAVAASLPGAVASMPLTARRPALRALPTAAVILSLLALAGAALASASTLLWSGSFPEPATPLAFNAVLAEARGWSAITLGLAVPLGVVALLGARRGSVRGHLAWTGVLAYLIYTYLEMAVSPPFTPLYLVYVGALGCAIPALVMAVASIDLDALPGAFRSRIPRRIVAGFALVFALGLALAWLKGIAARTLHGDFGWPQAEDAVGHVVHALDLGLLVPLGLATAVLLLRDRPAAYLVTALQLVVAVCMGAALTGMVGVSAVLSGGSVLAAAPFGAMWLVWVVLAVGFFRAVRRVRDD